MTMLTGGSSWITSFSNTIQPPTEIELETILQFKMLNLTNLNLFEKMFLHFMFLPPDPSPIFLGACRLNAGVKDKTTPSNTESLFQCSLALQEFHKTVNDMLHNTSYFKHTGSTSFYSLCSSQTHL